MSIQNSGTRLDGQEAEEFGSVLTSILVLCALGVSGWCVGVRVKTLRVGQVIHCDVIDIAKPCFAKLFGSNVKILRKSIEVELLLAVFPDGPQFFRVYSRPQFMYGPGAKTMSQSSATS